MIIHGLAGMNALLFKGIHYHIKSHDDNLGLVDTCRRNLDVSYFPILYCQAESQLNGAIYCDDPCASQCQLIFVDVHNGKPKYCYDAHDKSDDYEECKHANNWNFDTLCTHMARRATGMPDAHKERRKRVVGVEWIYDCLMNDQLLMDNRYSLWEVM